MLCYSSVCLPYVKFWRFLELGKTLFSILNHNHFFASLRRPGPTRQGLLPHLPCSSSCAIGQQGRHTTPAAAGSASVAAPLPGRPLPQASAYPTAISLPLKRCNSGTILHVCLSYYIFSFPKAIWTLHT